MGLSLWLALQAAKHVLDFRNYDLDAIEPLQRAIDLVDLGRLHWRQAAFFGDDLFTGPFHTLLTAGPFLVDRSPDVQYLVDTANSLLAVLMLAWVLARWLPGRTLAWSGGVLAFASVLEWQNPHLAPASHNDLPVFLVLHLLLLASGRRAGTILAWVVTGLCMHLHAMTALLAVPVVVASAGLLPRRRWLLANGVGFALASALNWHLWVDTAGLLASPPTVGSGEAGMSLGLVAYLILVAPLAIATIPGPLGLLSLGGLPRLPRLLAASNPDAAVARGLGAHLLVVLLVVPLLWLGYGDMQVEHFGLVSVSWAAMLALSLDEALRTGGRTARWACLLVVAYAALFAVQSTTRMALEWRDQRHCQDFEHGVAEQAAIATHLATLIERESLTGLTTIQVAVEPTDTRSCMPRWASNKFLQSFTDLAEKPTELSTPKQSASPGPETRRRTAMSVGFYEFLLVLREPDLRRVLSSHGGPQRRAVLLALVQRDGEPEVSLQDLTGSEWDAAWCNPLVPPSVARCSVQVFHCPNGIPNLDPYRDR